MKKISVVIPALNSIKVLESCLSSIAMQEYPKEKVEIILADGGSTDGTRELAKKYGAKVVPNLLKTGEAGKAVGVKNATGDYIALIDTDNILPSKDWFMQMITPLEKHPTAVGSEPWEYTWRKEDSFITRYSALIGMNDPLVHFLGNYDRMNLISGVWTKVPHEEKDFKDYLLVTFDKRGIPTIGANGTVFRTSFLTKNLKGDYLFDIDILSSFLKENGSVEFVKVKNGIIHTFCEGDVLKFARKQKRRIKDYLYYNSIGTRDYDWSDGLFSKKTMKMFYFIFSCATIIPLLIQSMRGYLKKSDIAWFFHPLACEVTLFVYALGKVTSIFNNNELNRKNWKQ